MNLNLFENRKNTNDYTNKFIEEMKNALTNLENGNNNMEEESNELDEYNLYEKRKLVLDNKSINGNELAWIMDDKSVCISEHGDGGPYSIIEIDLPKDAKAGEVYEKIDGKYVYNETITEELGKIGR